MEKANLYLNPVNGEELEKAAKGIFDLDPALVTKLKDILFK